jgi:arylsulfatase A-like enzyme
VQVNDARDFIDLQKGSWFVWLALNAPHSPFHVPPLDLHSYDYLDGQPLPMRPIGHYQAMIEAMDTELGRLLDGLPKNVLDDTWIVFLGDNGTPRAVVQDPVSPAHSKDTLYQGGVHVPLFIAGPGIVQGGRRIDALVHTVDLFSTILDLAGVDKAKAIPSNSKIDSISLKPYLDNPNQTPLRAWVFTELFGSTSMVDENGQAIRDDAFKLIRYDDGHSALYDLRTDPQESADLIAAGPLSAEATTHKQSLDGALDALLASK